MNPRNPHPNLFSWVYESIYIKLIFDECLFGVFILMACIYMVCNYGVCVSIWCIPMVCIGRLCVHMVCIYMLCVNLCVYLWCVRVWQFDHCPCLFNWPSIARIDAGPVLRGCISMHCTPKKNVCTLNWKKKIIIKKIFSFYKYDKNNKILAHKTNCNETCDNFH